MEQRSRAQELRELMKRYGDTSIDALNRIRAFGDAVVEAMPAYLGESGEAYGVPPFGAWELTDYNDAKYSFFHERMIFLEPIQMGVVVNVLFDRDYYVATRVVLHFALEGGELVAFVGDGAKRILRENDTGEVQRVCADIFEHVKAIYERPINSASTGENVKIGF